MPTGTKIAAIVLVVLLAAAGLYYAFVPPTPSNPSGSSGLSGNGFGSRQTGGESARPSTLPPAGVSGSGGVAINPPSSTVTTPGLDALMERNRQAQATGSGATGSGVTASDATVGGGSKSNPAGTATLSDAADSPSGLPPANPGKAGRAFSNGLAVGGTQVASTASTETSAPGGATTGTTPAVGTGSGAGTPPTTVATNSTASGTGSTPTPSAPTAPATAKETAKSSLNTTPGVHVVQKGETMQIIAKARLGSMSDWKRIANANPTVDPNRMAIGTKLVIPTTPAGGTTVASGAGSTPSKPASAPSSGGAAGGTHVVAKGETLSKLAEKYYGSSKYWKMIANANPNVNANSLPIGTRLRIPARATVVSGETVDR